LKLRVLRRTVVLECYANKFAREALKDIKVQLYLVEPLKTMIGEMVEYALEPCGVRARRGPMRLG
jgi:hypothetical protein